MRIAWFMSMVCAIFTSFCCNEEAERIVTPICQNESDSDVECSGPECISNELPGSCPLVSINDVDCTQNPESQCVRSEDCTDHANGFCADHTQFMDGCSCHYHECRSDFDCSAGKICQCDIGLNGENQCLVGCRSNDDCPSGECCAIAGRRVCGPDVEGTLGTRCTSPQDECGTVGAYMCLYRCYFDINLDHFSCLTPLVEACE